MVSDAPFVVGVLVCFYKCVDRACDSAGSFVVVVVVMVVVVVVVIVVVVATLRPLPFWLF